MDQLTVHFHHEGNFVDTNMSNYEGLWTTWKLDPDKWSYFEAVGMIKEMGYREWIGLWYDMNGVKKVLQDDDGSNEMCKWAESNRGEVHLYIVHPISQITLNEPATLLNEPAPHLRSSLKSHNDPKPQKSIQAKRKPRAQKPIQPKTHSKAQNTSQPKSVGDGDIGQNDTVEVAVRIDVEDETVFAQKDGYVSDDSETVNRDRFNDSDDEETETLMKFDPLQEDEVAPEPEKDEVTPTQQQDQVNTPQQEARADQTQYEVGETSKKRKKGRTKKKNGRPKNKFGRTNNKESTAPSVETNIVLYSDDDLRIGEKRKRKCVKFDRGLSDEEYNSETLETDDSKDSCDEEDESTRFPSFVMPKKMLDYKWVNGSLFSTKEEFLEACRTYAVHNGREIEFVRNESDQARAICKEGCPWEAYCRKLPSQT